jgi:hypothetical protein
MSLLGVLLGSVLKPINSLGGDVDISSPTLEGIGDDVAIFARNGDDEWGIDCDVAAIAIVFSVGRYQLCLDALRLNLAPVERLILPPTTCDAVEACSFPLIVDKDRVSFDSE